MVEATDSKTKLPRRDWVLLPLIGIVTVVLMSVCMEWTARRMFAGGAEGTDRCQPYMDPYIGFLRRANCTFRSKNAEGAWVQERYNNKGYREDSDLSDKPAGAYRIVQVGTSFGVSAATARESTLAALLPVELSASTGRKVELYNESIAGFPGLPQNIDKRFDDVLAAKPDLILWVLTRWDLKSTTATSPEADGFFFQQQASSVAVDSPPGGTSGNIRETLKRERDAFTDSKSALLLKHYLARSQSRLIASSESDSDDISGYLRKQYSPLWESRLRHFEAEFASVAAKAAAANVPLVVTMWPGAGQTAMVSAGKWGAAFDPYKLDRELSAIVNRHGGRYLAITPKYRDVPNPETGYLGADGHPNAAGNEVIARFLARDLTAGATPTLKPDATVEAARGQR